MEVNENGDYKCCVSNEQLIDEAYLSIFDNCVKLYSKKVVHNIQNN